MMIGSVVRTGLAALLLGGAAVGCTRSAVRQKTPPDPLLVSKKPVEGVPLTAPPAPPRVEAPPPPYPGGDVSTLSVRRQ
jgi:hypothetical protein